MNNTTEIENESNLDSEVDHANVSSADTAKALEASPHEQRLELWNSLEDKQQGEILPLVNGGVLSTLLEDDNSEHISKMVEHMEPSDIADIVEALPEATGQEVIDSLAVGEREKVESTLAFDDDSIGRLLDYSVVTVSPKRTVEQLLKHIRSKKLPKYTDLVFLVGAKSKLLGCIYVNSLLEAEHDSLIADLNKIENLTALNVNSTQHDAALLFKTKHFISLPVVDDNGILLGRLTFDDVIDVINEEADHQLMGMAGLDEDEDLFAPVLPSSKRRAVWLGINLITAFLASWAIGLFSATLEQVVALAVLMPIVASMGGIAGSQTLTLTIRGLALDQVSDKNRRALLLKEIGVAALNGVLWSVVVGAITWLWFTDLTLSAVITVAILANTITAAFAGWAVPLILKAKNIDPAISGSVVLTTVTDIVGFVIFLGLGTLWLI